MNVKLSKAGVEILLVTLALMALMVVMFLFVEPAYPRIIRMAVGTESGAYRFALKYREILARDGIEVQIRGTTGSVENLRLLKERKVDLVFAQTGIGKPDENPEFTSLASVFIEPLWVFYRSDVKLTKLSDLSRKKIAIGRDDSGTQALARKLLTDNGGIIDPLYDLPLGGEKAAEALKHGEVEIGIFVAPPESEFISDLLNTPDIQLISFERIEAYKSRYRCLSAVTLYQGVMDLARNIPSEDVKLIAPTAALVVREDFHPALAELVLRTAFDIHQHDVGIFEEIGQFPSDKFIDFPLNKNAKRYFQFGPSFLNRHLPFWAAAFIGRMKFIFLPLLTMLLPLVQFAPPIYEWKTRRKIYHWYGKLIALENEMYSLNPKLGFSAIRTQLHDIDCEVAKVSVPLSFTDGVYNLRAHIKLIQEKVSEIESGPKSELIAQTVEAAEKHIQSR